MVRYVDIMHIDGETFIDYCSESDFNYSIKVGQKCKIIMIDSQCFIGKIHKINQESFILQLNDKDEKVEIICADIDDIFTEEEIGIIN